MKDDANAGSQDDHAKEHEEMAGYIRRLRTIATELDEIGISKVVGDWASRAAKDPPQLLVRFDGMLRSFEAGLREHFAHEEPHLSALGEKFAAQKLVRSLESDHRDFLAKIADLRLQTGQLIKTAGEPDKVAAELEGLSEELRRVLGLLESHAEKEDEVLFITGHNL